MEIILPKHLGFCFGVSIAVNECYNQLNNKNKEILIFGEVANNPTVIEDLKLLGAKIVHNIKEIKNDALIIIRAHGVERKVIEYLEKNNIKYIDKTCPKIKIIYEVIKNELSNKKKIIIMGNKLHPEILGITSRTDYSALILNDIDELKQFLKDEYKKEYEYCMVFQTTFNINKYNDIINLIEKDLKNIKVYNTICSSTYNRQEEIEKIAISADAVIVIGGRNSSNSNKLYEIANQFCSNVQFIENDKELKLDVLKEEYKVLICSGSSTPQNTIDDVIEKIVCFGKKNNIEIIIREESNE